MASTVTLGIARLACAHSERRSVRSSSKPCLIRCEARCTDSGISQPAVVKAILPGLLAAAVLHGAAAHAGVVLPKSEGKKVFQGTGGASGSAPSLGLPSLPSFKGPSLPSLKGPDLPGIKGPSLPGAPEIKVPASEVFDPKVFALPAVVVGIGAVAFAASKLDADFGTFINEGLVKDSSNYTGYEEDEPQGRGSPKGFLGLGNLYSPAVPGGEQTAAKVKQASVQVKSKAGSQFGKAAQKAKSKSGGLRGLFK